MILLTRSKFNSTLYVVQIASTLMMTGLIWFVQIVHYPLFRLVGSGTFQDYEIHHQSLTTFVVLPLMITELGSACILLRYRPAFVPKKSIWIGLALLGIIWALTFFVHVPQHNVLTAGFDSGVHENLVSTNWFRTGCWSVRSILVGLVVANGLGRGND